MRLDELIARIGPDRFDAACDVAFKTAAGTGTRRHAADWPAELADVPHDCSDLWDDTASPLAERLALALDVYERMPCYANLMHLPHHYPDLDDAARQTLWAAYRNAIEGDDRSLADPMLYSLWVDFFEDPATVADAWTAMTADDDPRAAPRIDRVLACSGPVPWQLKHPSLAAAAAAPSRHGAVHAALAGAAFDVYGAMDEPDARHLYRQLTSDDGWPNAEALEARLSSPPRP